MKKYVLGVKIDDISMGEAVSIVEAWLKKPGKHYIVTPNPEILVYAQKDQEFKKILNSADLSIPDGKGLQLSGDIVCNTPGTDLMEALCKLCGEKGFTIGLLGGRDEVANLAAERLRKKYPKLKINFAESGGEVSNEGRSLRSLRSLKLDILFVAFGPPKQEYWVYKNLNKIDVKIAMGVGGAFDYISGKVPRAPNWIRNLGFEWLFRLVIEPWRIKRQLALLKYLFLLSQW